MIIEIAKSLRHRYLLKELEWLLHNKQLEGNYHQKSKSQIRKKLILLKLLLSHN